MPLVTIKETTIWKDGAENTPNHTYLYDTTKRVIHAYRIDGSDEIRQCRNPMWFDRRGRTFKQVTDHPLLNKGI
jgi:hypothetical protein